MCVMLKEHVLNVLRQLQSCSLLHHSMTVMSSHLGITTVIGLLILDSLPQLFHVIDLILVRKCGLAESPHRIVDSVQFWTVRQPQRAYTRNKVWRHFTSADLRLAQSAEAPSCWKVTYSECMCQISPGNVAMYWLISGSFCQIFTESFLGNLSVDEHWKSFLSLHKLSPEIKVIVLLLDYGVTYRLYCMIVFTVILYWLIFNTTRPCVCDIDRVYVNKTRMQVIAASLGARGTVVELWKKVKVARTRLPNVGFLSWPRFLAVSLQVTWAINPAVGCHYFLPGPRLPWQPLRGLLPVFNAWRIEHTQWVWTVCLRQLPDSVAAAIWTQALLRLNPAR